MIRGVVDNYHGVPSRVAGTASQMLEESEVGFLSATATKLLEMDFVPCPQVHSRIPTQRSQFFFCRFCKTGSAWAMAGRGLRSRNPNGRNSRWHCRIANWTRYRFSIKADRILPSQRFSPKPWARGVCRSTRLISSSCGSVRNDGRPGRSLSTNPARPSCSKRLTQYWTVRAASPKSLATSGLVMPWATSIMRNYLSRCV
jgi:hypothetical protein